MNKTISINIGGRNFFIEEEAYNRLEGYLTAIKAHFSVYPGSGEIIDDMENRIAEKFLENAKNDAQAVITLKDVENLITELGTVEDIAGEQENQRAESKNQNESFAPKRLMRDGNDKIIAGVCSGLAAYFGTDPLVFRLIAGLLLLAGGSIIPIYLLLWLIMPEAKTPTEKMQMRGKALNMSSLTQTVKERAEEFKEHFKKHSPEVKAAGAQAAHAAHSGISSFLQDLFGGIGKIIRFMVTVAAKIIGLGIAVGTIAAIAFITLAAASAIFNAHSPYIGFPLDTIAHGAPYYTLVVLAYIIAIIPLQLIVLFSMAVFSGKRNITPRNGFVLLGIWLTAIIAGGVIGLNHIPKYVEQIKNSPQMRNVTKTFDVKDFKNLKLGNSNNFRLIQGNAFSVKAEGLAGDLERINVMSENGTLTVGIKNEERFHFCIFCFNRGVNFEITAPNFDSITASNSSWVRSDSIKATSTALTLTNSSRANINYETQNLDVSLTNSSQARLSGSSNAIKAQLKNSSSLYSDELTAKTADVTATNSSRASIGAAELLKYSLSNSSRIYYNGEPKIENTKPSSGSQKPTPLSPIPPDEY